MTGETIRKMINDIHREIEEYQEERRNTFILDKRIAFLGNLNNELIKICPHEDDGLGFCKYCMINMIGE